MFTAILAGFAGSFIAPLVQRGVPRRSGWLVALLPLALFLYFASFAGQVANGAVFRQSLEWAPSLGLRLAFALDGLSLLFALLITGIGALIAVYAGGYLQGHALLGRFYLLLLMFMVSMLGVVLADNLLALFVFWELTSITSYLLIGFEHNQPEARASALQAFLVTGGGGLAMLGGLVLLGIAGGSYEISRLAESSFDIQANLLYAPALVLIVIGAFTKSAQFPFHFWLPNAMAAPTPVSAYLHSATMVKAGVYLLARLHPVLSGTPLWENLVGIGGLLTMVIAAFLALNSTDLKRILAYSTVSSLGTMVFLLGLGTEEGAVAALVFLLAHALYKGALFMIAGAIDHETGTRDVIRLGGLRAAMPLLAGVAVLAAVSLSGMGPVLSFIGKELLFEAALAVPERWYFYAPAAVIAGAVSVTVALIVTLRPFFGARKDTPKKPHEPPPSLWLGPALLAAAGLALGLAPWLAERYLTAPAAAAVLGEPSGIHLALWHGITPALGMSAAALAVGVLGYAAWGLWRRGVKRLEWLLRWGPEAAYGWSLIILNWVAAWQTRILQNGYLRNYLLIIMLVTVLAAGSILALGGGLVLPGSAGDFFFYEVILAGIIIVAALAAVRSRSRLGAIASLGVVGYSIALFYVLFGAPDLAMTQFLVESITVVLFVFAFYHLPQYEARSAPGIRLIHAGVGILTGMLMTALVLSALQVNVAPPISDYYLDSSLPLGHGRNIVNVILVDFRGFDTLGEITVLAVAAAGVFSILRFRRKGER